MDYIRSATAGICVVAVFVAAVLYIENRAILAELRRQDQLYADVLESKVRGVPLRDTIVPGSLGLVKTKQGAIICGFVDGGSM